MSTTRIRTALASAVVLASALTGCSASDEDPEPQGSSEPDKVDEPTQEPTQVPSDSPSPSAEPTPSASPSRASEPSEPQSALLTAAELPQLNDSSPWTEGRTTIPGQDPFGLCQQFDLVTIGATGAVERPFTSGTSDSDTAGQVVAEFPDAQNAGRASKVIQAWHRTCRRQIQGATDIVVRPISDVAVASGRGWWYLVSFERDGVGHFHSLGMVVSGTRMSLIRMDHDGQDHNYEPGQDPVELAVKAVSARLG